MGIGNVCVVIHPNTVEPLKYRRHFIKPRRASTRGVMVVILCVYMCECVWGGGGESVTEQLLHTYM